MSGGSFDYAYRHVQDFADALEDRLRRAGVESPDGHCEFQPSLETTAMLQDIAGRARELALLMQAVEWLYSGDTGDESFLDEVARAKAVRKKPGE